MAIGDFFLGYRETALAPDEIIARLAVRPPRGDERFGLYKVSKRKEMDISTFRAAILVREDFAGGRVDRAILAFAGVGPPGHPAPEHGSVPEGPTADRGDLSRRRTPAPGPRSSRSPTSGGRATTA